MKTLFKHTFGLIAILLVSFVSVHAHSHGPDLKKEKNVYHFSHETPVFVLVVNLDADVVKSFINVTFDCAELPAPTEPLSIVKTLKPIAVNDAKPDNTNWQLIRESQLKIRQMESNC